VWCGVSYTTPLARPLAYLISSDLPPHITALPSCSPSACLPAATPYFFEVGSRVRVRGGNGSTYLTGESAARAAGVGRVGSFAYLRGGGGGQSRRGNEPPSQEICRTRASPRWHCVSPIHHQREHGAPSLAAFCNPQVARLRTALDPASKMRTHPPETTPILRTIKHAPGQVAIKRHNNI